MNRDPAPNKGAGPAGWGWGAGATRRPQSPRSITWGRKGWFKCGLVMHVCLWMLTAFRRLRCPRCCDGIGSGGRHAIPLILTIHVRLSAGDSANVGGRGCTRTGAPDAIFLQKLGRVFQHVPAQAGPKVLNGVPRGRFVFEKSGQVP